MTDTVDKSIDEQLDEVLKNIIHIGYVYGYNQLAQMANVAPYNQVQPITEEEAKQAIKDLIATEVLHARIEELSNLKAEKGRFSTSSYGLWVDGAIDNRIVELEAQLNKSFSYQITKSNKEIKTQLEDKS